MIKRVTSVSKKTKKKQRRLNGRKIIKKNGSRKWGFGAKDKSEFTVAKRKENWGLKENRLQKGSVLQRFKNIEINLYLRKYLYDIKNIWKIARITSVRKTLVWGDIHYPHLNIYT